VNDIDEISIEQVQDICEYLDCNICCHPDYNAGEVTEDFCLKCENRKIPVKTKAISLLLELSKLSDETGWELEGFVGTDENSETQSPKQKLLCDLSNKIQEVNDFLHSLGVLKEKPDGKDSAGS